MWHWIPNQYRHCATFSDFWETYQIVFGTLASQHQSVGKDTGQTAHVERWNNTLRQRLARFVRKTLVEKLSEWAETLPSVGKEPDHLVWKAYLEQAAAQNPLIFEELARHSQTEMPTWA